LFCRKQVDSNHYPMKYLRLFYYISTPLFILFWYLSVATVFAQAPKSSGGAADHFVEQLSDADHRMIDQYRKTAERHISLNDVNEATRYLNKIAYLYWEKGHGQDAIRYFTQSLKYTDAVKNQNGLALIYNNIGMIYADMQIYDKAIESFTHTLNLRKQSKQKVGVVSALLNIATMQGNLTHYTEAIKTLETAFPLAQELNDERLMANCYGALAQMHQKGGNAEKSIYFFRYYASFEQRLQDADLKKREAAAKEKIDLMAMHTQEMESEKLAKEKELRAKTDSLMRIDVALHTLEKKSAKEAKTHQLLIDNLNKEEKIKELRLKEQENQLKNEAYFRYLIYAILCIIALSAVFAYRSFKQKQRDNAKLAQKNAAIARQAEELAAQRDNIEMQKGQLLGAFEEITAVNSKITGSINYAKRIQTAMMPDDDDIHALFAESFILFKPRDIVSGDYYWFTEVKTEKTIQKPIENSAPERVTPRYDYDFYMPVKDTPAPKVVSETVITSKILITVADCTGHGVPGALLTMIGLNMLNDIVTVRHIIEPDQILNELHKSIRKALKQDETENRDGMDMVMCVVDKEAKTLAFAGAKNPLIYVQNNELQAVKGDMHPIGGLQKETERIFHKQIIDISQPTTVFLASDGYADQFGGGNDKKFTTKKFKDLLLQIYQDNPENQKQILDTTIENWKGKSKQLDDILVIGFKV
jgi:serine phosphatase RsbU (regulator of sigma subunit)